MIVTQIEPLPLTAEDKKNIEAAATMLSFARHRPVHKREPWFKAAGQHLGMLRRGKSTEVWAEIIREHLGLGLSRAYELMALASGRLSIKALRQQKDAQTRRWKASKRQKTGNSEVESGT